MKNGMGMALSALRQQVQAGLTHEFDESVSLAKIDQPAKVGDLFARAETAREELLLNPGCRPS